MPNITVKNAQVHEEKNNTSGKIMRSQMAALDLGNGYELPFRVGLGSNPAYQPGKYDIDPKGFQLNQYGGLVLGKYVDLIAVGAPAPAK